MIKFTNFVKIHMKKIYLIIVSLGEKILNLITDLGKATIILKNLYLQ